MTIKELQSYLDDDALNVKIGNAVYRIPSPNAETGLKLLSLYQLSQGVEIDDDEIKTLVDDQTDFVHLVLGDGLDELVRGGVSWVKIQRLSRYAFLFFTLGEEAADEVAAAGGLLSGEALAPNRAARRKASRAGATTTKQLASTAGTTSPRKSSPRRKVS